MEGLEKQTLGKYVVLEQIGRGNMGSVYLGHDPFTNRDVAIKVAHPEFLHHAEDGERYRKLFFNEAKVARVLEHPNIVSVYDAGIIDDICYLVMEYIPGGHTLQAHCKPDNLLPIKAAIRAIHSCAVALDYAHRNGVVHRDIKPRNILLTKSRDIKIGDFGVAIATRLDVTNTQFLGYVGSPLYMSPEQVREEMITNQTDIFSLGVVMYELLTGRHPFTGDSLPAIVQRIVHEHPQSVRELRSDVSPLIERILHRALRKSRKNRYRTAMDLAGDLSLVSDTSHQARPNATEQIEFQRVKALRFFAGFLTSEIWEVIHASSWHEFASGASILVEGETATDFFIIVCGDVVVRRDDINIATLTAGDCFGEMGALGHGKRSASVSAHTQVSAMRVNVALLERASSPCQHRFYQVFVATLIDRLSATTDQLVRKSSF
ncbi:MAG: serine/threonine-protein kinase [Gammaproteobacteria bacterium]|jgi:serine/threonine protein kinase